MKLFISLALGLALLSSTGYAADKSATYDIQYLDTMAKHHADGIKMFDMAADKAQSEAVRERAEKMSDAQEDEIGELNDLRNDINSDAPKSVNMKLPGMMPMDMGKLEKASGTAFDRQFLDMTIMHHAGAVKMSQDALKKAQTVDVKNKAHEIIDKQNAEIAELRNMKASL